MNDYVTFGDLVQIGLFLIGLTKLIVELLRTET